MARMERLMTGLGLNTVCQGAKCPNRNDCFEEGCATFLILGSTCTRDCSFCSIPHGNPPPPDPDEKVKLARAIREMGLRYAVITSVTRDDLQDGGSSFFAEIIRNVKAEVPGILVEVLIPDFQGDPASLATVLEAGPSVLNHNIETVPSMYPKVRPDADYARSLEILRAASVYPDIPSKSGLMVGFGETEEEVVSTLGDLRSVGVELVTIGQYLQPGPLCLQVEEYLPPERFERYREIAEKLGFSGAACGPFVRSSHHANELYQLYQSRI